MERSSRNILDEAEQNASLILSDPEIRNLLDSEGSSVDLSLSLVARLHFYYTNSRYIDTIYLIDPTHDLVLDQYGYFFHKSAQAIFSAIDENIAYAPADIPEGWNVVNRDFAPPYYIARYIPNTPGYEPVILVITLKTGDFVQIMNDVNADLCCLYNEQCEISTYVLSHDTVDWSSDQAVSDLLGKQVICVSRSGQFFNYMVALGVKEYYRPLHYILYAFLFYFAVIILYYILVFTREYRRRYARISSLVEVLPRTRPHGESYEDLWQAVHSAIIEFRENEQSTQELKRAKSMRYLINGYQNVDADLLRASGIEPSRSYYAVTLFISNYGKIWTNSENKEHVQVMDVIFQTAFERFESQDLTTACVDTYPNYSVLFSIKDEERAREQIRETLEKVTAFLYESFQLHIRCIVGRRIDNPEDIGRSFEETLDTYDFVRAVNSDSRVVFQDELDTHAGLLMGVNYLKQLQVLVNTVLLDKFHLIPSMTDTLIRENILPYTEHFTLCRSRTRTISNILIETVFRSSLSPDEQKNAVTYLSNCRTSPAELNEAASRIFSTLEPAKEKASSSLVTRACEYIQNNLGDYNLSLPSICESVGCSVQHLSRLFRSEKDTTINEYVHAQRIALSRALLQDGTLSIAQIAGRVGYASLDTFSRNFRRQTGMTPSEYRASMKS